MRTPEIGDKASKPGNIPQPERRRRDDLGRTKKKTQSQVRLVGGKGVGFRTGTPASKTGEPNEYRAVKRGKNGEGSLGHIDAMSGKRSGRSTS